MFILFFLPGYLPPFGHVTELGMKVFGVFLGLLWGWVFVDLVWTSVLGFFILALTGWTTPLAAVMQGFGNPTAIMCILSYCFAYCLGKIGVNETIAYWILGKKCFVGRPWLLVVAMAMIAQLLSICGGGFAAIFMMWGVTKTIAEVNGVKEGSYVLSLVYALILFQGMIGGSMVPFMGGCILYGGFLTKATGIVIEGVPFLLMGELYAAIAAILLILVAKFILKVNPNGFVLTEEMRAEYKNYKNSRTQLIGLVATAVFFVCLLLPSVFHSPIWAMFGQWGIVGWSIIYIVFFNILKGEDGEPVCTVADCFNHGIGWNAILLFMVTIPLAGAMESEEIGIIATVYDWCMALFGNMSLYMLYIAIAIFIGLLTQFLHNMVMGAIFTPIFAPIVIAMGGNPITFFMVIYAALCCSFATPAASMQAALIFGKNDVPRIHSYSLGIAYYIVSTIVIICMIPLFDAAFASYDWQSVYNAFISAQAGN